MIYFVKIFCAFSISSNGSSHICSKPRPVSGSGLVIFTGLQSRHNPKEKTLNMPALSLTACGVNYPALSANLTTGDWFLNFSKKFLGKFFQKHHIPSSGEGNLVIG